MMRFDRLRRVTRDELAWRSVSHTRTAVQRLAMRVHQPHWDRRQLQHAIAGRVADGPVGAAIDASDWPAVHDALAVIMRSRRPRFVLDPGSAALLRHAVCARWPSAPARAAERADRVLTGHYDLLGYRGLEFGASPGAIDWHLDPVHNRRAPREFWADVPYLDPAIGDHKIIWELNRHQHWLQLGRALWLTGDRRYGRGIASLLESWLAANPPLLGINWASMLEIGFRAISWTWAIHFLLAGAEAPALQEPSSGRRAAASAAAGPWLVDLLVALDRQMTHLEQNLSYYFSPNTHLTGEALALYVVGAALPELRGSDRWLNTGRRILLAEIDRQIHADGGHAERSTHYQRYTLDFYLLACLTARRIADDEAAARFADAAARLADFTRAMADDRGRLPLIGDDDGGMLWPMTGRACYDVRDSLALAAVILRRPELAPWGLCEEALWLGGRSAIADTPCIDAPRADTTPPASRTLVETGYVVLRDGRGGHAVFDAGRHGYLNGGHAHADALALTLTLGGRPFLVDPGTSTYTMAPRLRDHLRSSMSHNTVTLDDRSQALPSGPFHWSTRAEGTLHAWRHNPAFDWAEGSHDGYAPLGHRRAVMRVGGRGWLVADDISGEGRHSAAAYWHFDPAWMLTCDEPGRLRATHLERGAAWLLHDGDDIWLAHGDEETGLGWYAPTYGTLIPTWSARITRHGVAPIAMVTWIGLAGDDGDRLPSLERLTAQTDTHGRAIGARIVSGQRASTFVLLIDEPASRDGRACGTNDFQTNARVLHYEDEAGQLAALDLVDASHALAIRDGWISVAASEVVPDLHVVLDADTLDLGASAPPSQLRVEGGALHRVRVVRANGRDVPAAFDHTGALVVRGVDWGRDPRHAPLRPLQTAPSSAALPT